ncbi:MAG: D-amino acid dehydrogenase [Pseudomonadota bacterium]
MHIVVLGAGVVGATSAWFLAREGHRVTVVDRQPEAARETSFANGGQVSVSHAEPWANPDAPARILKWLGREDAPLRFRPRLDVAQWGWGARFLLECLPARTARNAAAVAALARLSHAELKQVRAETGIEYDSLAKGILHVFTEPADYEAARRKIPGLQALGLHLEMKTRDECCAIEPALAASRVTIHGGFYCPDDESGDARKFTQALAARAAAEGVEFRYGVTVERLERKSGRITGVRVDSGSGKESLSADAYVLSLGSYSPRFTAPLGERLPIFPVKGYSVTIPAGAGAPFVSLTDEAQKLVFSRLGERLRVAGMAELAGYELTIDEARCRRVLDRVFQLLPEAGDRAQAEPWTGLRPATPGNVPVIGRSRRYRNLCYNTGHGTLGWTLSCGSARVLADVVAGRELEIGFPVWGV